MKALNLRIEDISHITRSVLEMLNIEPFDPKGEGLPVEFMDHGSTGEEKEVFCLPEDYPLDVDCGRLVRAAVEQALEEMTCKSQERERVLRGEELRDAAGKFALLVTTLSPMDRQVLELADWLRKDQLADFRNGLLTVGKLALELLERHYGTREQALTDLLG